MLLSLRNGGVSGGVDMPGFQEQVYSTLRTVRHRIKLGKQKRIRRLDRLAGAPMQGYAYNPKARISLM